MANHKTAAILVCAGSGARMKGSCPDKLLLEVAGKPVAAHAMLAYDQTDGIDLIVIVTRPELVSVYQSFRERYHIKKEVLVTIGGATRMESVLNGVKIVPSGFDYLAIGDGARPLIRPAEIRATLEAAWKTGAAALGVYLTDTVKEVQAGMIVRTLPRECLVGIQTPQVFRREEYLLLAEKAVADQLPFTDDASIYEHFGKAVAYVEGRRDNMKITAPEDIPVLRMLLEVQ